MATKEVGCLSTLQRMMCVVLIVGLNGQDGSYLSELLLVKGYEAHGLIHRHPDFLDTQPFTPHDSQVKVHHVNLTDAASPGSCIDLVCLDEVYNLVSQPDMCFSNLVYYMEHPILGPMGACCLRDPQRTCSPPWAYATTMPTSSPLFTAIATAFWGCNVVLFPHASPRLDLCAPIDHEGCWASKGSAAGKDPAEGIPQLGRPHRFWVRGDYVEAMWLMLQQEELGDYVVATGEVHMMQEFLSKTFDCAEQGLSFSDVE